MSDTVRIDGPDDVTCESCGNTVTQDGFSTATREGWPVEPIDAPGATGEWDGKTSVCLRCGALFEQDFDAETFPVTVSVVGVARPEYMIHPKWASWTWGEPTPAPVVGEST